VQTLTFSCFAVNAYEQQDIAAAALFLASKLEEHPIRIRDLINCFDYLIKLVDFEAQQLELERISGTHLASSSVQKFNYKPMDYFAKEYYDWKDDVVIAESQILKVSHLSACAAWILYTKRALEMHETETHAHDHSDSASTQ
jgi:hypothetical protein